MRCCEIWFQDLHRKWEHKSSTKTSFNVDWDFDGCSYNSFIDTYIFFFSPYLISVRHQHGAKLAHSRIFGLCVICVCNKPPPIGLLIQYLDSRYVLGKLDVWSMPNSSLPRDKSLKANFKCQALQLRTVFKVDGADNSARIISAWSGYHTKIMALLIHRYRPNMLRWWKK